MKKLRLKRKPFVILLYISLVIPIGLIISHEIKKDGEKKIQEFKKNYLIYDSQKMTDIQNGPFMAEGKILASEPQSLPSIPGRYMEIRKVQEEYRTHTRIVTHTDGKGHTHSRPETYHSWDETGRSETYMSSRVSFLGREFKISDIKFYHRPSKDSGLTQNEGHNFRTVYYTYPEITESGVLKGKMEGGIGKDLEFTEGKTIQKIQKHIESKPKNNRIAFWIIYLMVMIPLGCGLVFSIED